MNSRTLSLIAMAGFVLLGAICMGLRYRARQEAQSAREDTEWELTYSVEFEPLLGADREVAVVKLALPLDTRYSRVLGTDRVTWTTPNSNLKGEERGPFEFSGNRELWLSTRQSSTTKYQANVKSRLRLSPRAAARQTPLEGLSQDARSYFLRDEPRIIPKDAQRVRQEVQAIVGDAATDAEKLQRIFGYCTQIDDTDTAGSDVIDALTTDRGNPLARARTMVTLSRAIGIPARLVTGFRIRQGDVQPHVWTEEFLEQSWVPYDPTDGYTFNLPMNYVPVRRGGDQVAVGVNASGVGGAALLPTFSIRRLENDPSVLQGEIRRPIQILNLMRLPVPMHTVMKILLLLPFAALITTILRNVVGLQTFGTFSPALLAMSFIYADLTTGLAILAIVIAVGLVGRTFLEKLRLLMVPRLSIILTLVILCVVFGVSILHFIMPSISAEVVLLPMVIMTMLIERFHVSAEEDGMMFTIQLAAGTLLVAVLCYLVLLNKNIGEFVLTYPETHFFTIAAFIFLGRYAGYRLTELWRFSDLVDSSETIR